VSEPDLMEMLAAARRSEPTAEKIHAGARAIVDYLEAIPSLPPSVPKGAELLEFAEDLSHWLATGKLPAPETPPKKGKKGKK